MDDPIRTPDLADGRDTPAPTPPARSSERRALLLAALGIIASFAAVAFVHRLLTTESGGAPALLIAVVWLTICAVVASFGTGAPRVGLLATAAGLVAVYFAWPWLVARVDLVYLAQHAGSHALLALLFGSSLVKARRGRSDPLITQLARRVHGTLPPELVQYTTRLTWLWTLYFIAMAATSLLLYTSGSVRAWSVLANLVTPPLVVGLFVAEYAWRLWRYPNFRHASLLDGVRAFRQ